MSTGESDYAKRVVERSMQLANSRADVENVRMRIKAVDKEHEQRKKDRADRVDRFDAALRATLDATTPAGRTVSRFDVALGAFLLSMAMLVGGCVYGIVHEIRRRR